MFERPTESHLKYFDLPGVGTVFFPWERRDSEIKGSYSNYFYYSGMYPKLTYYEHQKIQSYDALLHVSSDRLKIYDSDLYIKTRRNEPHKIVFIVHNKVNVAFDQCFKKKRRDINNFYNLTNNNLIYLIDALNISEEFRPMNDLSSLKSDILNSISILDEGYLRGHRW